MFKVSVKNFQSIANAEIEVDGLTVVTGKNNSGKSALLRAVNSVFTNALGSSFVRNGEDYCEVEIDFGKSETVRWRKGEKVKPTYWLNGGDPIHSGRNAPSELEQFGVLPIKANGREIWPQIAPQFTGQVFLIDLPGSVMAEMVADVDRVSDLNLALRKCEKDKRSNNSLLKIRNSDHAELKKEREKYDDLEDRVGEFSSLSLSRQHLKDLYERINKLVSLRNRYITYFSEVENLNSVAQEVSFLDTLSDLENDLLDKRDKITSYEKLGRTYRKQLKDRNSLMGVSSLSVPTTENIKRLRGEMKALTPLLKRKNNSETTISLLSNISHIEIPEFSSQIETKLSKLLSLKKKVEKEKNSVYIHNDDLSNTKKELKELELEISQTLSEHGECPYCGSVA